MNYSANEIKECAENMGLGDFNKYLIDAMDYHRELSNNIERHPFDIFNNQGTPEKIFFDRLTYLTHKIKNKKESISELRQRLIKSHEKLKDIQTKIKESDREIFNLREKVAEKCSAISLILIGDTFLASNSPNPYSELLLALRSHKPSIINELNSVFSAPIYEPMFTGITNDGLFVKGGNYEYYLKKRVSL